MLAEKLNMKPEEAERWIVNLIRNARLDAKIDSKLVRMSMIIQNVCYVLHPHATQQLVFEYWIGDTVLKLSSRSLN